MRVLMISLDRGLFGGGFSGDVVQRHQKYADLAGYLDVIVFAGKKFESKIWQPNFRVFSTRSSRPMHYRNALKLARKLHEEVEYNLVVTQDFAAPVGQQLKTALGIKWIVNIHSMFFGREWLRLSPIHWLLYLRLRMSINIADGFKVNNEIIKQQLLKWKIRAPIIIQPTPVNIAPFKTENKTFNPVARILYVGRLSSEKNVALLIRACQKLSVPYELNIVGEGKEEKALKKISAGKRFIYFLGAKTGEELIEIFKHADIFVLPSNTESFGVVLLQAAAAKCAIIATATEGAQNFIRHNENGLLVAPGDEMGLTQVITKVITDMEWRKKLASQASRDVAAYDSERGIKNIIQFWAKILG